MSAHYSIIKPTRLISTTTRNVDRSLDILTEAEYHEVYVAPSNIAKCLVVEASKYLRERFWKKGPEWTFRGFSREHHYNTTMNLRSELRPINDNIDTSVDILPESSG